METVDKIPVTAQVNPANARVCSFTVGHPLFPKGAFLCASAEMAEGSPLLQAIFQLPGVVQVWVSEERMTVEKNGEEPWPILGKRVAKTVRDLIRSGVNPLVVPSRRKIGSEEKIFEKVRAVLEKDVNPFIAAHGGRVDVTSVKGSTVYLTMDGGCQGCAAAASTMKGGVESAILSQVPEVSEVLDATDHAGGSHPCCTNSSPTTAAKTKGT